MKLEAKTSNQFVVFCRHLGRAHEKKNIPIFAPSKCLMYVAGGRGESPPKIAWQIELSIEARTCFTEIMRGEIKTVGTLVDWLIGNNGATLFAICNLLV